MGLKPPQGVDFGLGIGDDRLEPQEGMLSRLKYTAIVVKGFPIGYICAEAGVFRSRGCGYGNPKMRPLPRREITQAETEAGLDGAGGHYSEAKKEESMMSNLLCSSAIPKICSSDFPTRFNISLDGIGLLVPCGSIHSGQLS